MKQKVIFLSCIFSLVICANVSAYDFVVNGIYYSKISQSECEVTFSGGCAEGYDYSGDITIPDVVTYSGTSYVVKLIGFKAFKNSQNLTSVTIPASVTCIDTEAFYGCSNLTYVTIPNSITSIGTRAFVGCSKLTNIHIPNSLTKIEDQAFIGCSGLEKITIPSSILEIGCQAFDGCTNLTRVDITDLESWCKIKFETNLNYRTSNPCSLAHHLYLNGQLITNLVIPSTISNINNDAFCGCSDILSITIPNSVKSIGGEAFYGCI